MHIDVVLKFILHSLDREVNLNDHVGVLLHEELDHFLFYFSAFGCVSSFGINVHFNDLLIKSFSFPHVSLSYWILLLSLVR